MAATQKTQASLIEELRLETNRFTALTSQLSEADQQRPFTTAGWSVKDFLAHMAHWKKVTHALLVAHVHDQPLPPVEPSNEEANRTQQHIYASLSLQEAQGYWEEVHTHLIHLIESELDDNRLVEMVRAPWDEKDTLPIGELINEMNDHDAKHFEFIEHYFNLGTKNS